MKRIWLVFVIDLLCVFHCGTGCKSCSMASFARTREQRGSQNQQGRLEGSEASLQENSRSKLSSVELPQFSQMDKGINLSERVTSMNSPISKRYPNLKESRTMRLPSADFNIKQKFKPDSDVPKDHKQSRLYQYMKRMIEEMLDDKKTQASVQTSARHSSDDTVFETGEERNHRRNINHPKLQSALECDEYFAERNICYFDRSVGDTITFVLGFDNLNDGTVREIRWNQEFHVRDSEDTAKIRIERDNSMWNMVLGSNGRELRLSPITESDLYFNTFTATALVTYHDKKQDPAMVTITFAIRPVPIDLGYVYPGEYVILNIESFQSLPLQSANFHWHLESYGAESSLPSNMKVSPSGASVFISELRVDQEGVIACRVYSSTGILLTMKRFLIKEMNPNILLHPYDQHPNRQSRSFDKRSRKIRETAELYTFSTGTSPTQSWPHSVSSTKAVLNKLYGTPEDEATSNDLNSSNAAVNSLTEQNALPREEIKDRMHVIIAKTMGPCENDQQCSGHGYCSRTKESPGFCLCFSGYHGNGFFCWERANPFLFSPYESVAGHEISNLPRFKRSLNPLATANSNDRKKKKNSNKPLAEVEVKANFPNQQNKDIDKNMLEEVLRKVLKEVNLPTGNELLSTESQPSNEVSSKVATAAEVQGKPEEPIQTEAKIEIPTEPPKVHHSKIQVTSAFDCDELNSNENICYFDRNVGDTITFVLSFQNLFDSEISNIRWKQEFHIWDSNETELVEIDQDKTTWNVVLGRNGKELRLSPITETDIDFNKFTAFSTIQRRDGSKEYLSVSFSIRPVPIDMGSVYPGEQLHLNVNSYISLPLESLIYRWYLEKDGETSTLPSNMRVSPKGSMVIISELRKEQEGLITCCIFSKDNVMLTKKRFLIKEMEANMLMHEVAERWKEFLDNQQAYLKRNVRQAGDEIGVDELPVEINPQVTKPHTSLLLHSPASKPLDHAKPKPEAKESSDLDSTGLSDLLTNGEVDSGDNRSRLQNVTEYGEWRILVGAGELSENMDRKLLKILGKCITSSECSGRASCLSDLSTGQGLCQCHTGYRGNGMFCWEETVTPYNAIPRPRTPL